MLAPVRTPLIRLSNLFPEREVYAKCEFLAPSGSFKIHGATHLLTALQSEGRKPQLIVPSMGNTALGAAVGAKAFGFEMIGVVPQSISQAKDERLRALGVELMKIAGGGSELLERARQLAEERNGYFVHPHLDPLWTDGYQVIADQVLGDLPACKSLVFPVGGGGLLMGITERVQAGAGISLFGCEPYNFPKYASYSHQRSRSIADGLLLDVPHPKVQRRIAERGIPIDLVEESEIQQAMARLFATHGLIVEPSSAITLACIERHGREFPEPICAILTGANIAREDFDRLAGAAA
jgi:threonine dehydratase